MNQAELERALARAEKEIEIVIRTLSNARFLDAAPDDIIERQVRRLADWKKRRGELQQELGDR
ncbi:MAG: hypothetical protein GF334_11855 [Candidatus Altiarchaeales archaeon]|nr:hypothetical protein [Candidatus Altiarchaeales archaeon]